jgi:pyruvate dehydrogenase E2 component (dihydrolipoamide acetyltransferase)
LKVRSKFHTRLFHTARSAVSQVRDGRVQPEDVEGSTFTITNLGTFDIDNFNPIINPPVIAILAIGTVTDAPVVKEGEMARRKGFKATPSTDHRVANGAEVAHWLQAFENLIEDPLELLIYRI